MNLRRRELVLGAVALATAGFGPVLLRAQQPERVIKVVARKFVFLPNDITLKLGEPVVLEFTAPEVVMGFNVPDWNIRTDIIPGQVARLRVQPDKTGTFDFLCDIFCGEGHEGMSGKLHVAA